MKPNVTNIVALASLLVYVLRPEISAAGTVNATIGVGAGSSSLWTQSSEGGIAAGGTYSYRTQGPSVSFRLVGLNALTPVFSTYQESVTELALMGGWDFTLRKSSLFAIRLGIGRMWYHGGYPRATAWDYSGHAWGPALQFDLYWKRIGFTYMMHTGDPQSFSVGLICVRLGRLRA
ncbi:MAG: hypothetical protein AB1772_03785 [Candidatus Zixiibacteriota bacterium]